MTPNTRPSSGNLGAIVVVVDVVDAVVLVDVVEVAETRVEATTVETVAPPAGDPESTLQAPKTAAAIAQPIIMKRRSERVTRPARDTETEPTRAEAELSRTWRQRLPTMPN